MGRTSRPCSGRRSAMAQAARTTRTRAERDVIARPSAKLRALAVANPMVLYSEARWQREVMGALRQFGWTAYHTHNSKHSQSGFPDVCGYKIRGAYMRLLFAELKREDGKVTDAQAEWLAAFREMGDGLRAVLAFAFPPDAPIPQQLARVSVETYLWRPSDWDRVLEVLR
jgi:hypothetical protein